MLAKATANEASINFISKSGSEFCELYVGMGASRVRDLFKKAKSLSPCIIFIDEIDALGSSRKFNLECSDTERNTTLNELLVQMDGFNENNGIFVIGATNTLKALDEALLRPGRFD